MDGVNTNYSEFKTIKVSVDANGVSIIQFDRPDQLNAVGSIDLQEVKKAVEKLNEDDACKIIIS